MYFYIYNRKNRSNTAQQLSECKRPGNLASTWLEVVFLIVGFFFLIIVPFGTLQKPNLVKVGIMFQLALVPNTYLIIISKHSLLVLIAFYNQTTNMVSNIWSCESVFAFSSMEKKQLAKTQYWFSLYSSDNSCLRNQESAITWRIQQTWVFDSGCAQIIGGCGLKKT